MDFRVSFLGEIKESMKVAINQELRTDEIDKYEFVENFHCFRLLKTHTLAEKGVEKLDKDLINSTDFITNNYGQRLVSFIFIFINTCSGKIYTNNCNAKKLKEFMLAKFQVINVKNEVDPEKLNFITKIELVLDNDPQLSLLYDDIYNGEGSRLTRVLEITDDAVEIIKLTFELKRKTIFSKNALKDICTKYKGLVIEGTDEYDNILKIKDGIQLTTSINSEFNDFESLKSTTLLDFVTKLKQKEEESLGGY